MSDNQQMRIGWLGPSVPSSSHIKKFLNLVPANVEVLYEQLVLHDGVLNDVQGKQDLIVSRAAQFAEKQKLDGLIFPGAPREALNPRIVWPIFRGVQDSRSDSAAILGDGTENFFRQTSNPINSVRRIIEST